MSRADYEIFPVEVKQKLEAGEKPVLLDVRRHDEVAICILANALHLPMDELEERVDELDENAEIIVYCHHGVRSLSVAVYLRGRGFKNVKSLAGGIDLWSKVIDPSVPRY
jgi:rhodanese-related sulfurtransferase